MSTNLSKQKREETIKKISEIRNFLQNSPDKNAQKLLGFLGDLENDVQTRKFGLIFEEHREEIDEILENNLPVFIEDKTSAINKGGLQNFIIEGDNLASLKLLEKTRRGAVDLIYIDPPYNTGNKDFIYDDCFVDTNDTFRHSKWCSFMEKRLKIAKNLLSNTGVIFISVDDNEQAVLKVLCDSIFGPDNFESFIWKKKGGAGNTEKIIGCLTEYILCYFKKKQKGIFNYRELNREYRYEDEFGPYNLEGIEKTNSGAYERKTMLFPIVDPNTNKEYYPSKGMRWTLGEKSVNEAIANHKLFFNSEKGKVYRIKRPEDYEASENVFYNLFLEHGSLATAKDELADIILDREKFDTPKPLPLIMQILEIASKKDSLVLDFFAGSGTTGHAVLEYNTLDNGNRKFILCTNNENNIARDVTYERLKTVITGKRKDGSKYSDGYKASLKYLKVDFVNITDKLYYEYADELLEHIKELVELENAINFDEDKSIAICLTEYEVDEFTETINEKTELKKIYLGHDIQLTDKQETLFENLGVEVIQIPEYYYDED